MNSSEMATTELDIDFKGIRNSPKDPGKWKERRNILF